MPYSSLAVHDSASSTSPSGNIAGENGALSLGHSYRSTPNHAPGHVTNHNTQENGNVSTLEDLEHGAVGPTMGLDYIPPFTITPQVRWSAHLQQGRGFQARPCPCQDTGGLTSDSVPLLADQIRTGVGAPAGLYRGLTAQPIQQTHLPTTYPYTLPNPPQPNTTSYSTPNNYTLHHPPMQIPNQIPTSEFFQECLRPFPVQSLQGPRETRAGSEMRFHKTGTIDNRTAHMLSDHRLPTSSDHEAQGRATYKPDDLSARNIPGVVYEYGSLDQNKYNSAQAVGSDCWVSWSVPSKSVMPVPQERYLLDYSGGESTRIPTNPSAPATHTPETRLFHDSMTGMTPGFVDNHARIDPDFSQNIGRNLPSSCLPDATQPPYEMHPSNRLPHTGGGDLPIPSGPPVADHPHEHIHRNRIPCEWVNPNGMRCNVLIGFDCKKHFSTVHGIENISSKKKVKCLWCPPRTRKRGRKNFLRHIREVHMKLSRTKIRGSRNLEKKKGRRRNQS
ncbi:hypothetical protein EDC04DRAFT_2038339 [Pisolithus marmoratus]|nr:hypothetical protein EDC04DRAFT_2038339 [Pisolithus marmoratus]